MLLTTRYHTQILKMLTRYHKGWSGCIPEDYQETSPVHDCYQQEMGRCTDVTRPGRAKLLEEPNMPDDPMPHQKKIWDLRGTVVI